MEVLYQAFIHRGLDIIILIVVQKGMTWTGGYLSGNLCIVQQDGHNRLWPSFSISYYNVAQNDTAK